MPAAIQAVRSGSRLFYVRENGREISMIVLSRATSAEVFILALAVLLLAAVNTTQRRVYYRAASFRKTRKSFAKV